MTNTHKCVLENRFKFVHADLKIISLRYYVFPPYSTVICCVYVSADSYFSVHIRPSMEAHELLRIVSLKMDKAEEDMVLAVVSHSGGTHTTTGNVVSLWKSPFPPGKKL